MIFNASKVRLIMLTKRDFGMLLVLVVLMQVLSAIYRHGCHLRCSYLMLIKYTNIHKNDDDDNKYSCVSISFTLI